MKKELEKRKDEPLYKWIERIARYYRWTDEETDVVSQISKQSYFNGSNDAIGVFKKNDKYSQR